MNIINVYQNPWAEIHFFSLSLSFKPRAPEYELCEAQSVILEHINHRVKSNISSAESKEPDQFSLRQVWSPAGRLRHLLHPQTQIAARRPLSQHNAALCRWLWSEAFLVRPFDVHFSLILRLLYRVDILFKLRIVYPLDCYFLWSSRPWCMLTECSLKRHLVQVRPRLSGASAVAGRHDHRPDPCKCLFDFGFDFIKFMPYLRRFSIV